MLVTPFFPHAKMCILEILPFEIRANHIGVLLIPAGFACSTCQSVWKLQALLIRQAASHMHQCMAGLTDPVKL